MLSERGGRRRARLARPRPTTSRAVLGTPQTRATCSLARRRSPMGRDARGRDQEVCGGRECGFHPAARQRVQGGERVSGEGAQLSALAASPPAEGEGAVQLDGPLVEGYGRGGLPLPIEPLSLQEGFERPERARAERSEEHTSELQSQSNLVCRLLLEKKTTAQLTDQQRLARHAFVVVPPPSVGDLP